MKRWARVLGSLLAAALAVISVQAMAVSQADGRAFNHMTTGFALSGGHAAAACETCHSGGVFKGTPRNCDGCHATGKRIVATPKSNTHIITDAPCESCHFNTASWLGARFNHGTAKSGQCATCHNGRISTGKTAQHVATTASCDSCHRSSAWIPASWNHNNSTGDCVNCHKAGGAGRTYSASHLSAATMSAMGIAGCNACHKNFYSFYSARYDHAGASTQCDSCHGNAAYADLKSQKKDVIHTVTTAMGLSCQSCHKNYVAFTGATFDHAGATVCENCHNGNNTVGGRVLGKGATHFSTTQACASCHKSKTTWTGATFDHATASTACETCHANSALVGIKQKSSAIHNVTTALGLSCQSCHKSFTSFSGGKYEHTSTSACATCHSGSYTVNGQIRGKHASHVVTTATCNSCHQSTTSWQGASGHNGSEAGQCLNCHVAQRPANHTGSKLGVCDTCHSTTTWVWNHAGATACSGCHNGSTATGKSATHIPYIGGQECSACHIGTSSWNSVITGSNLHAKVVSTCETCHANAAMKGVVQKSNAIHNVTTALGLGCQSCHKSYTSFTGGKYEHTSASACATCHSGTYTVNGQIRGKHAGHIVTSAACDGCHKSKTTWLGASGHSGNEAGQCLNCHISQRPSNHNSSAYLVSCDACHTTSSWNFNHAAQQGKHTCVNCHLADGQKEHKTITVGSKYYYCDNCHSVNTWDR